MRSHIAAGALVWAALVSITAALIAPEFTAVQPCAVEWR
jgi:hypothetical protein